MEHPSHETSPSHATPRETYEQNHMELLELLGHINGRLAAKYRADLPRGWEHVGEQEEVVAMLRNVAGFFGGVTWPLNNPRPPDVRLTGQNHRNGPDRAGQCRQYVQPLLRVFVP